MTWARILAFVSGGLPVLTFPEPGLWWLAYVCLVPWLLLVRAAGSWPEAALRGWLGGAGFLLAVHHWLLPVTTVFMPLIAAVVGLLWLPWGALARQTLRRPVTVGQTVAALAVVPSGWVLIEVVRSWEHLGGPWGLLGASQASVDPALAVASLGGVWLVSLLVAVVNVALVLVGTAVGSARAVAAGVAALVVLAAPAWSALRPEAPTTGVLRVSAVQPGTVPGADARIDAGVDITESLAGQGIDLVAWGESSVARSLGDRPDVQARLSALAETVGAPLLVNVDARRDGRPQIFKTAALVGPDGVLDEYDKTRLVPFGEYIPLRGLLGWVGSLTDAAAEDRRRGSELVVMDAGPVRVGPLVCFESAFPDLTRQLVRVGADVVVVQSSTWTFQDSWAPEQHAALAALRAAESGRPVVHVTLTGQTTAYDARGRQVGTPLTTGETGAMVVDLPLASGRTAYVVLGDWVPVLSLLVVGVAAVWPRVSRAARGAVSRGRRPAVPVAS